ncbi:MAG: family 16 glycoside hydrolase [Bryobacter sp.]|nr:family 16 glycoside hydrolase [Bryobacter sp.]
MWRFFWLPTVLLAQGPGWTSEREYENVRIEFEYKLEQWAEAALCLRTATVGRPVAQGVSLFLAHDFHQKEGLYTTGALAGRQKPLRLLPASFGVWHKAEVLLDGAEFSFRLDGELLQYTSLPEELLGKGFLHWADLGHGYEVRNWKVEDLGAKQSYVEAWSPYQLRGGGGEWQLAPAAAVAANGHGIQYGAPVLEDFVFVAEVKASALANGGIFLRGSPEEGKDRGFEVQIYPVRDAVFPTGSIYGLTRAQIASDTAARWFQLRVLVKGTHCQVWVDGVLVAESWEVPPGRGRIGLQIHNDKGQVEWRRMRAWKLAY